MTSLFMLYTLKAETAPFAMQAGELFLYCRSELPVGVCALIRQEGCCR